MKNQKGITLIALVITIIVLIILAAVAINLTLGENGIFTKAQTAKEQYEMAEVKEKLDLAILEVQTEEINNGELTLDTMLTKLQGKLPAIELEKDGETLKGTLDGYDFVIDSDFKVTIEGYNPETGKGGSGKEPEVATYTVIFSGENVTSSGASTVKENETYTATLTPTEDYEITDVTVKMGETTLTQGTHYTYENGSITIASVTGNLTITVTTESMPVENLFGQRVNYIDLDGDETTPDWQIFYKEDGELNPAYKGATYIIPKYYVPASKMPNTLKTDTNENSGMSLYSGTYKVNWASVPSYKTILDGTDSKKPNVKSIFMYDYTDNATTRIYSSVKAVSRLLDVDAWKDNFVTSDLQAKGGMAIGGPTINMWCASWNKAYPTEKIIASIPEGGTGYQVNGSDHLSLKNYTGYKTDAPNVYFPTKSTDSDGTFGYWLASPSSYNSSGLMYVRSYGDVGNRDYDYDGVGVRPLVYLPKEVTLTPDGTTANLWNINYGE